MLVLTTYDTDADVLPAIEAGATGYLLKDARADELFRAVRAAARGEAVLSPSVATRLLGQVRRPAREPLSQREQEVLELVARGATNREAARQLFVSEATVKTHLLHVYAKLGVNDRPPRSPPATRAGCCYPMCPRAGTRPRGAARTTPPAAPRATVTGRCSRPAPDLRAVVARVNGGQGGRARAGVRPAGRTGRVPPPPQDPGCRTNAAYECRTRQRHRPSG